MTGSTGLFSRAMRLGVNSSIYAVTGLLTRSISFFLVPVFTRALTPSEYGILAVTGTVGGLLGVILSFALHGSITRMYFECRSADEQRSLFGTLLLFLIVVPGLFAAGLEAAGRAGFLDFFDDVPFWPYLSITLWGAYLSIFMSIPTMVYVTREQPFRMMVLTVANSIVTIGLSLYLVVYLRLGVIGALQATLISSALMAVVAIILTLRMASLRISISMLKMALLFSLPLVPHLVAQWALNLSDRLILKGYVSTAEVGLYSLGYQFGLLFLVFAAAMGNAIAPIVTAQLKDEHGREQVPPLGSYALLGITVIGLGIALLSGDAIRLLTPAPYHGATVIVPWIVLGAAAQGVYYIWSLGTWFSMQTKWVPVVTLIAGIVNVVLNLLLVPRFGILAAAVNTAVAYIVLALLHGYLAHKLYPISWEYGRWARIFVLAVVWFFVGEGFKTSNMVINILVGVTVMLVFPISLSLFGFWKPTERNFMHVWLSMLWLRLRGVPGE